jgi:hypothetical protein
MSNQPSRLETLLTLCFFRKTIGHVHRDVYKNFEGKKYGGVYAFTKPIFVFRDPDIAIDLVERKIFKELYRENKHVL